VKLAIAQLESVSPYSQSRRHDEPREENESIQDWERRTWRSHLHVNEAGFVFIPPMAMKKSIEEAAAFLGLKIAGEGNAKWTKNFLAGIMVFEPIVLPLKPDDVQSETHFMNPEGRKGGAKRVPRTYPVIHSWSGEAHYLVTDEKISKDIFRRHLDLAGSTIGIGRFRPRCGGFYGRYKVKSLKWGNA
jgi:hypothetical protein